MKIKFGAAQNDFALQQDAAYVGYLIFWLVVCLLVIYTNKKLMFYFLWVMSSDKSPIIWSRELVRVYPGKIVLFKNCHVLFLKIV